MILNKRRLLITLLRYETTESERAILNLLLNEPDLQVILEADKIQAKNHESIHESILLSPQNVIPDRRTPEPSKPAQITGIPGKNPEFVRNCVQTDRYIQVKERYSQVINGDTSAELLRLAKKLTN
jgi:hypothetical protein